MTKAVVKSVAMGGFWSHVNKDGPVKKPELGPCWVWTAATQADGYGVWKNMEYSHRYSYRTEIGPIPEGHLVMHRCDNPPCCRPTHLTTGTNADNLGDMASKGRARGGRRKKDGSEPRNRQTPQVGA